MEIEELCRGFVAGTVSAAEASMVPGGEWYRFASFAPVLAVRAADPELVRLGLIALTLVPQEVDIRDKIMCLAGLYYAASVLGLDAVELFAKVAQLAEDAALAGEMKGFPLRLPLHRDLQAFCLRPAGRGTEFRFESELDS